MPATPVQGTQPGRGAPARLAALAALSLALVSAALVATGDDGWLPFASWIASLAALFAAVRPPAAPAPARARPAAADVAALLLVLALAAVFRLHAITVQPNGYWIDELSNARNALRLADSGSFTPFGSTPLLPDRPDWVRTQHLYLYFSWLVQRAAGYGDLGVVLISVVPGILAAPALYVLARALFDRAAALAAAALFAVSLWHVTLSRWGWDEVLWTTLAIVVFALARAGAARGRSDLLAGAGAVSGLSLYGYVAARLGLLAALVYVALAAPRAERLRSARIFLAGAAVAAAPLLAVWLADPHAFGVRLAELSIVGRVLHGDVGVLGANLLRHLGMFNLAGDPNPRHDIPGAPMLDPWVGALFAAGVVRALLGVRRPAARLALVWLSIGLLAGVLSNPAEAPQAYRTGFVAPACFLLVGHALDPLFGWLRRRLRAGTWVAWLSVGLLVAASAEHTWGLYFHERVENPRTFRAMGPGATARFLRLRAARVLERGATLYVDSDLFDASLEGELNLLRSGRPEPAPGVPGRGRVRVVAVGAPPLPFPIEGDGPSVLLMPRARLEAMRAVYPRLSYATLMDRFGRVIAVAVSDDATLVEALRGVPPAGGRGRASGAPAPREPAGAALDRVRDLRVQQRLDHEAEAVVLAELEQVHDGGHVERVPGQEEERQVGGRAGARAAEAAKTGQPRQRDGDE